MIGDTMLDTTELLIAVGGEVPDPDKNVIERLRLDDSFEVPIELTDADVWANYVNDDLYVLDKKIREFLAKTRFTREKNGGYKTTASIVFAWIFGRKPQPADGSVCRVVNKLLEYYCTSYTGETTFQGKKVSRVYKFSRYAAKNKRPYSLRLRLEESDGKGKPFRRGPGSNKDKRDHGRRADCADGAKDNG